MTHGSEIEHGGALTEACAQYGGTPSEWVDLSTGINPWPYPVPEVTQTAWHRLPERPWLAELADAARHCYSIPNASKVVAAPGSQAIIQWLPFILEAGDVAIVGPTYGEYALAWRRTNCHPVSMVDSLHKIPKTARHVVVCQPNNPDGRTYPREVLLSLSEQLQTRAGGYLIVDEAFADVDPQSSLVPDSGTAGLVVLRSMGKFFGLAGMRVGFAVTDGSLAARLSAAIGPWALAGPSIEVATKALRDVNWQRQTRERLSTANTDRLAWLREEKGVVVSGTDLFTLLTTPNAPAIAERLAMERIWVRSFAANPNAIRLGVSPDEATEAVLRAALLDVRLDAATVS